MQEFELKKPEGKFIIFPRENPTLISLASIMGIVVPYSPLPGLENTGVLAPMVPVTFINGKYEFSTFALVDSGAESAVISTVIADALNIKWERTPKKSGFSIGSSFIFHIVRNLEADIFDHNFSLNVNVVEGIFAFKCILGRRDIFKWAKIAFEGYKNQFEITFREFN